MGERGRGKGRERERERDVNLARSCNMLGVVGDEYVWLLAFLGWISFSSVSSFYSVRYQNVVKRKALFTAIGKNEILSRHVKCMFFSHFYVHKCHLLLPPYFPLTI